jgi:hypothetical protein
LYIDSIIYILSLHGFYCDGKPIFDTFLQICGTLEFSHQAQVSAETVIFVHLTLIDNDMMGSPFKLAHDFLVPYFPNGRLLFHEVVFDVGSELKIDKFHTVVTKLVSDLLACDGGWNLGYEGTKKIYVATPINAISPCVWFHVCTDSPKQSFWILCLVLSRISLSAPLSHTYGYSVAALLSITPKAL